MPFRLAATALGRRSSPGSSLSTKAALRFGRPSIGSRGFTSSRCWRKDDIQSAPRREAAKSGQTPDSASTSTTQSDSRSQSSDWEHNPDLSISKFSELPEKDFGVNQHLLINADFKEALRQILWQFRAPIRYAFAYGSGVFPQAAKTQTGAKLHPNPLRRLLESRGGTKR